MTAHLLEVEDLAVRFATRRSGFGQHRDRTQTVRAVDGVSFTLDSGELLAIVGESGSGKTTTAQASLRLNAPSRGVVRFKGTDIWSVSNRELRRLRREMQLIYQDPYESLDPRYTVRRVVEEPLRIHGLSTSRRGRDKLVSEALERVGLTPVDAFLGRLPHELSGGQRQRVSIAAALTLEPALLVADEPVSMLDVSVRAGILELLDQLRSTGLGVLMITHDLTTAAHYADRIAVMYLGRIVEIGPSREVIARPRHPYTQALLSVVPRVDRLGSKRIILSGEMSDGAAIPAGCRFHPRCPVAVEPCATADPILETVGSAVPTHWAACHLQGDE
ncbi:MAG: ABC transporter ATP-binding protein [Nocardioidaceae bacterium]